MTDLDGKVAIVTGGARGQGRSHAIALARAGAHVAICDIANPIHSIDYALGTEDELEETVRLVQEEGREALGVIADVSDSTQVDGFVNEALAKFSRIDILIANAGVFSATPVAEMSDRTWQEMMDTNLTGVFNSMRAVIPHMIERGSGRIVATSSAAGKMGSPNLAHYCASKWGVIGLVKSVALELCRNGITVNAVCPTNVNSGMLINEAMFRVFLPGEESPTLAQATAAFATTTPMGVPWVEPEDISHAVLFLVSDEARFITGETVSVMAGQSALMNG